MVYQIFSAVLFIVAVVAIAVSLKLLVNKKWIMGFLRGTAGIVLLVFSVVVVLTGKDLYSYKSSADDMAIVTLSFHKKEGNTYLVELQGPSSFYASKTIEGQQWQINARMFKWPPLLSLVGLTAGYRLESLSGRFIELQLDQMVGQKPPEMLNEDSAFDVWSFLNQHPAAMPLMTAYMATPGFVPTADGAIYEVKLTGQNLTVDAVNEPAKNALKNW
jgi:hypothetical protein